MPAIPPFILKKLYVKRSLRAEDDGFALDLKNSIAPATIVAFTGLDVDGQATDPADVTLVTPGGDRRMMSDVSTQSPLMFDVGTTITLCVSGKGLEPGLHELVIHVIVQEVGPLEIPASDALA